MKPKPAREYPNPETKPQCEAISQLDEPCNKAAETCVASASGGSARHICTMIGGTLASWSQEMKAAKAEAQFVAKG